MLKSMKQIHLILEMMMKSSSMILEMMQRLTTSKLNSKFLSIVLQFGFCINILVNTIFYLR
uniref:Uncharacterized protein n=1 Tax=Rhinolophus ferrumequinum TaxID=59479 RepID=A0A671FUI5_RHIFE